MRGKINGCPKLLGDYSWLVYFLIGIREFRFAPFGFVAKPPRNDGVVVREEKPYAFPTAPLKILVNEVYSFGNGILRVGGVPAAVALAGIHGSLVINAIGI